MPQVIRINELVWKEEKTGFAETLYCGNERIAGIYKNNVKDSLIYFPVIHFTTNNLNIKKSTKEAVKKDIENKFKNYITNIVVFD